MENKKTQSELKNQWHPNDKVLDGATFEQLITQVICNNPIRDAQTVRGELAELVEQQMLNAHEHLEFYIEQVIAEIKNRTRR